MSSSTGHLAHRLLQALHRLGDAVPGQLLRAQAQFTAVPLAKGVQSAVS